VSPLGITEQPLRKEGNGGRRLREESDRRKTRVDQGYPVEEEKRTAPKSESGTRVIDRLVETEVLFSQKTAAGKKKRRYFLSKLLRVYRKGTLAEGRHIGKKEGERRSGKKTACRRKSRRKGLSRALILPILVGMSRIWLEKKALIPHRRSHGEGEEVGRGEPSRG